jgi:hypothetical protein
MREIEIKDNTYVRNWKLSTIYQNKQKKVVDLSIPIL